MRLHILLLCLILSLYIHGQNNYVTIDKIALQLPDVESKTTDGIADYINNHFEKQEDKARAIFCWITHTIAYDVENMYNVNFYQNKNDIVKRVLQTRKGICMSYTELFNEIAERTGLKSYAVHGYTKQNNKVDVVPHAWNAVQIGTEWHLIDATWGAGYIQNGKFVRHIENNYFNANPQQYILSHTPFDPLWQMLGYTITNQEFYDGKTGPSNRKLFSYKDSIAHHLSLPESDQLAASARRIEANGVKNGLIFEQLQHIRQQIDYLHNTAVVTQFNEAVKHYNNGITLLNQFIDYSNKQFNPTKEETDIRRMVDTVAVELAMARKQIAAIEKPDAQTATSIGQLSQSIDRTTAGMNEQKAFVDKYFKTGKLFRKTLFYKYK
jgi:Transglutaminase-like superfamily